MAAESAAESDSMLVSAWNRNYRVGLTVIVAGIVALAAVVAFSFWANSTGHYPASFGASLAIYLVATAGFMLIVLGGSWVYTNRRLLQLSRRNARAGPPG